MHLAIDAMGGDFGPHATVRGTLLALAAEPSLTVTLYGRPKAIERELASLPQRSPLRERLAITPIEGVLPASASPSDLIRGSASDNFHVTSLHAVIHALECGEADGCVSAGDTGALMALARARIGMLKGISRPAISSAIPALGERPCYMLDLGANVDCQSSHLMQFAVMGSEMVRVVDKIDMPRVGLLNIGSEQRKGGRLQRATDELLRSQPNNRFTYIGYVEGDGIYRGDVDVIVCDGFVGNVALKTSEGLARMLGRKLQSAFESNLWSRLVSLMARPALARFKREIDPVRYNGASLLGLGATVVKSHGSADARGFSYAIARAVSEINGQLPSRLAAGLAQLA